MKVRKSSKITYLGFNHLEKYEFVNGKDDIPYMMENNGAMFETTQITAGVTHAAGFPKDSKHPNSCEKSASWFSVSLMPASMQ